jgi:pentatricopeptide repeat protein
LADNIVTAVAAVAFVDIARYCPTIANRTVFRQETKERAKGCYICGVEGHHAEECPELAALSEEFSKFVAKLQSGMKLHVKVYNILLEKCAKALELNGALYLIEQMQARQVTPNDDTWQWLQYVFDRSGRDQSKLTGIPMLPKRVARLKELVTQHRRETKVASLVSSEGVVGQLAGFLRGDAAQLEAAQKATSLFQLASLLKRNTADTIALSASAVRDALAAMKHLGRYRQRSSRAEFDLEGDITQPGKLSTLDATGDAAASGDSAAPKKKSKTAKKIAAKKRAAKAAKKEATDADDTDMADAEAGDDADDANSDADMDDATTKRVSNGKTASSKKRTNGDSADVAKKSGKRKASAAATDADADADATAQSAAPLQKKQKKKASTSSAEASPKATTKTSTKASTKVKAKAKA